ncbi:MAG TPA: hypothetical protein PKH19_02310 [Candidatus Syntrophosphaera sp.]|nr:hypothetical protein [Candidatus Syntrophosphaera sp.]
MNKTVEFRLRGSDPSAAKLRAMIEGLKVHAGDGTLQVSETMVLAVSTERDDVAAVLSNLAKLGQPEKAKKPYNKLKVAENETGL